MNSFVADSFFFAGAAILCPMAHRGKPLKFEKYWTLRWAL
jgi:hypothetical protein